MQEQVPPGESVLILLFRNSTANWRMNAKILTTCSGLRHIVSPRAQLIVYTSTMAAVDRLDHYCTITNHSFVRKFPKRRRKVFFGILELGVVISFILFNISRALLND